METKLPAVALESSGLGGLSAVVPEPALSRAVPLLARRDQDLGRRDSRVARRQEIVSQMMVEPWNE